MNTDEIKIIKYAKVIKIYGRTGLGGVTQVLVRLIDEPKRTLIRNIKGPIRLNDIITLLEWERETRIKK
jgi:small subunit ribosomal protein S28e|tara:strand:- start:3268 stop:3474 length:207 start_codon:yes stop_codon:yes gene_type:complete